MGNPSIKGHQVGIQFFKDGKQIVINNITNLSINQDSDFSRSQYLGNPIPEGDQVFNGWSGSFDLEVKGSEVDDLMEGITTQNYNGAGISDLSLIETENYGDSQTASYIHQDVQLKMSKSAQGNSKVTKKIDFQSSFRSKL